jgi:phosphomethylpyrimidine synthase
MKVMQDLLRYAAEHGVSLDTAVAAGMTEKSVEFLAAGGAVYLPPQALASAG